MRRKAKRRAEGRSPLSAPAGAPGRPLQDGYSLRCECGAMFVDVRLDGERIGQECPACEALELVDVVRQLHVRRRAS